MYETCRFNSQFKSLHVNLYTCCWCFYNHYQTALQIWSFLPHSQMSLWVFVNYVWTFKLGVRSALAYRVFFQMKMRCMELSQTVCCNNRVWRAFHSCSYVMTLIRRSNCISCYCLRSLQMCFQHAPCIYSRLKFSLVKRCPLHWLEIIKLALNSACI